jgi:hypothetical protein
MKRVAIALARPLGALLGLAVLAIVLSPGPSRRADAQVALWTSCRNVCMRSCQWEKRVMGLPVDDARINAIGNKCFDSPECKRLQDVFAPSDPKIDSDARTAAVRFGQCKKCASTGRKGRCPVDLFGMVASTGGASYGGSTYGGGPDRIGAFTRCFEQSVRDRIAEGYYVKNYSFVRGVRTAGGGLNPFLDKSRGGRCGEYGEWGMKWIKPCVDLYFPGALVDDLFIEEKSSAHEKHVGDYVDAIYAANHRATRVVLPDGRRFVVDYWDAVGSGDPELQPQTAWVKKWRDRIGPADSVLSTSDDEVILKKAVVRLGEEKGLALFRKQNKRLVNPEIWIKSWQREPW